jgi:hypothetical protein
VSGLLKGGHQCAEGRLVGIDEKDVGHLEAASSVVWRSRDK